MLLVELHKLVTGEKENVSQQAPCTPASKFNTMKNRRRCYAATMSAAVLLGWWMTSQPPFKDHLFTSAFGCCA